MELPSRNELRRMGLGHLVEVTYRPILRRLWASQSLAMFFAVFCVVLNVSFAKAQGTSADAGSEAADCGDQYDHTIALDFGKEYQKALKARDYARLTELKAQKDQTDLWAKTSLGECGKHNGQAPRPAEDGWWTNRSPGRQNTIKCDGKGNLVVHQGSVLPYGLGQCTVEHENEHIKDWKDRYGKNLCQGRQNGDLPYYAVNGKDTYDDFLKKSECGAWNIGLKCREKALAACKTEACKKSVLDQVKFGKKKKTEYCGA